MALRHIYLSNTIMHVSDDISPDRKIRLNKNGYVLTPLTKDAEQTLANIPGFEIVEGEIQIDEAAETDIVGITAADDEKIKLLTEQYEIIKITAEKLKAENEELKIELNDLKAENEDLNTKLSEISSEKTNDDGETEPKEGDTKIENGKGFVYKKNSAGKLTWLRYPEIDEK